MQPEIVPYVWRMGSFVGSFKPGEMVKLTPNWFCTTGQKHDWIGTGATPFDAFMDWKESSEYSERMHA